MKLQVRVWRSPAGIYCYWSGSTLRLTSSQLPKENFDPHCMDPADYYDALALDELWGCCGENIRTKTRLLMRSLLGSCQAAKRKAGRKEAQPKPDEFVQGDVQRMAVGDMRVTLYGAERRPGGQEHISSALHGLASRTLLSRNLSQPVQLFEGPRQVTRLQLAPKQRLLPASGTR
eukprot:jgi/Chlat1/260/Chrsp1S08781